MKKKKLQNISYLKNIVQQKMKKCKILDACVVFIDDYLVGIQRIYYRKQKTSTEYHAFSEIVWPTGVATSEFNKLMHTVTKKGILRCFCDIFALQKFKSFHLHCVL